MPNHCLPFLRVPTSHTHTLLSLLHTGDLYNFAEVSLQNGNITYLPKMCGMIPVGIQFANGYDIGGSPGLGLPCPDEVANGWPNAL